MDVVCGKCVKCGRVRPVRDVLFLRNLGGVVIRFTQTSRGPLCLSCIHKVFWEHTTVTLLVGWLGIVSAVIAPVFIANNVVRYMLLLLTNGPYRRRARELDTEIEARERDLAGSYERGDIGAGLQLARERLERGDIASARRQLTSMD